MKIEITSVKLWLWLWLGGIGLCVFGCLAGIVIPFGALEPSVRNAFGEVAPFIGALLVLLVLLAGWSILRISE